MTVTFDPTLATEKDQVRFHIGDTSPDGAYIQDETIEYLLTTYGSVGGAVVSGIRYIITQLSKPNFRLDWMQVTNDEARKGYEAMLTEKQQEFGIGGAVATVNISQTHRADSYEQDADGAYTSPTGRP